MKKHKLPILGIAIIGVIGLMLFTVTVKPTQPSISEIAGDEDIGEIERAIAIRLGSIVDTDVVFVESDESILTNFLDENNLAGGSETATLETSTILFDSDQNQFPTSSFLGIPSLSVTDSDGNLLDLGTMHTGFFIKTTNPKLSIEAYGKVKFFLGDQLIADKWIWLSSQSEEDNQFVILDNLFFTERTVETKVTTFVVELDAEVLKTVIITEKIPIPPSFSDRKQAFTFTISDEGRDWIDGSTHTYRVIITEFNVNADNERFGFTGEFLAYALAVTVDGQKIVVLGDDNNAISIFKSDATFVLTTHATVIYCGSAICSEIGYATSPTVSIYKNGEFIIDLNSGTPPNPPSRTSGGWSGSRYEEKINLQRGTDYILKIEGVDYPISTPLSQSNWQVSCSPIFLDNKYTGEDECVSNFGYAQAEWMFR